MKMKIIFSLLTCIIGFTVPSQQAYSVVYSDVTYQIVKGLEVSTYLDDLDVLRKPIYSQPPYSYDISEGWDDLDSLKNEEAIFVLASHNNKIVGMATGVPLKFYAESWLPYFRIFFGDDLNGYFYNSDLLVNDVFDQHAISVTLLEILVQEAFNTKKYRSIVAYSVVPKDKKPFEKEITTYINRTALQEQGFVLDGIVENIPWSTPLGVRMHTCDIWIKTNQ